MSKPDWDSIANDIDELVDDLVQNDGYELDTAMELAVDAAVDDMD